MIIIIGRTQHNEQGQKALAAYHNVSDYIPNTMFNSLKSQITGYPTKPEKLPKPGAASQLYSALNLIGSQADKLYLIQLGADGAFQDISNPERTANHLIEAGLSKLVKDIYLVISDVPSKRPLTKYADRLAMLLNEKEFDINIKTCSSKDHPVTFICPPETPEGEWQIFGIQQEDQPDKALGYEAYCNHTNKTLLWEGKNIDEWFDNPDRTYTPMFRAF